MDLHSVIPFILVSLSVYRVSFMVTAEEGPFELFQRWRNYWRNIEVRQGHPNWITDGVFCQLCVSFWLGWVGAFFVPFTTWGEYAIIALALSGVTLILRKKLG